MYVRVKEQYRQEFIKDWARNGMQDKAEQAVRNKGYVMDTYFDLVKVAFGVPGFYPNVPKYMLEEVEDEVQDSLESSSGLSGEADSE